ncbi:unnamed protein product [Arctia plantaginis]|uniref:Uncharacterized protein n=1 Tax=Arctia plantaginis TaxID=874455 RepID=A0A8S0YM32_ARCPL|nr:unnamed protein product [Arctia plantaginis]CAB3245976.1 unnamed protein product [Arctia plantaginis]
MTKLLATASAVGFILSSPIDNVQGSAQSEVPPGVYYIEELDEHKDAYMKMVSMRNGKRIELSPADHLCHNAHAECVKTVSSTDLVCTHHARYGLVNFPSFCEIRFQNCLVKSREVNSGKKSEYGKFYYNGQRQGCEYYVEKTNTVPDAIKQYFSEDTNKDLNTYIAKGSGKKKH